MQSVTTEGTTEGSTGVAALKAAALQAMAMDYRSGIRWSVVNSDRDSAALHQAPQSASELLFIPRCGTIIAKTGDCWVHEVKFVVHEAQGPVALHDRAVGNIIQFSGGSLR
jgi:hypothetical protein